MDTLIKSVMVESPMTMCEQNIAIFKKTQCDVNSQLKTNECADKISDDPLAEYKTINRMIA